MGPDNQPNGSMTNDLQLLRQRFGAASWLVSKIASSVAPGTRGKAKVPGARTSTTNSTRTYERTQPIVELHLTRDSMSRSRQHPTLRF
jgi:hypothetical protein